jgi:catechol 2,3-dioxygenase-like lactoylglutathione lyase family enzyme
MEYKALNSSPMIPSYNISKTVKFFTELLGFSVLSEHENYVILSKDRAMIHLLRAGNDIGEMEFYLEIDNIDNLWENIKDRLDGIKVKPPFDREYGMRELHIILPETKTLMFVGQVKR